MHHSVASLQVSSYNHCCNIQGTSIETDKLAPVSLGFMLGCNLMGHLDNEMT